MKSVIKVLLLILNLIILMFSIMWFMDEQDYEPLIVFLAQISSILIIVFNDRVSSIYVENIKKSKIKVDSRIKDTKVRIKNVDNNSEVKIGK